MHRETLLEGSDKKLQVCVGITNKHRHFIQHIYNIVDKTGTLVVYHKTGTLALIYKMGIRRS